MIQIGDWRRLSGDFRKSGCINLYMIWPLPEGQPMRMKALLTIAVFLMAASAIAQGQIDFSKVEIKTTRYNDKFYTFEGSGGMIGALIGPDGTFMVDTQYAPLTDKIVAAIKKVSPGPIRF